MSRRPVSPIKTPTRQNDPRDNIIKKLKDDLIVSRGRQKQLAILENYLIQLIEKTKLLTAETAKSDEEGKLKLELTNKSLNELKKELESLKTQLRNITNELDQIQQQQSQLKKILNTKLIQIQKHKKEGTFIHEDNDKLLTEQYRLRSQEDEMNHQIRKLLQTLKDYEGRLVEVNHKILQVKDYINEISEENMILKQKLKKFQIQNTHIGNDLDEKENKIDLLEKNFAQKHELIKNQVENYIELEQHNDKIIKETKQKVNLTKIQNEKFGELSAVVKKLQKNINQKSRELHETVESSQELQRINQEFYQQNNKLKEELRHCQDHLQNLMRNNALMQEQMEGYMQEDEMIVSIIRRKKLVPIDNMMKMGRQSVKASPLRNENRGGNTRSYQ